MKSGRVEAVIPDEVITEILSWLPVKPLLRFRCVCKFWKTLISNPQFVKLHLQRSSRNANLIVTLHTPNLFVGTSRYHSVMSCSTDSLLDNSYLDAQDDHLLLNCKYSILGSCNGLVCLHTSSYDAPFVKCWVRLWNPELRLKSKDSPCLPLGFNNLGSGFGYDKSSDTYKVVAVLSDINDDMANGGFKVKVYTIGDSHWRDIQRFPAFPLLSEGKFVNGTLNWLAIRNLASSGGKQLVIVSLDLSKETYKQMLLPDCLDEPPYVPTIGVLGDCLCLFRDYNRTHCSVWQMKEFGVEKSWTQSVNVSYEHLQIGGRRSYALKPLYMSENGDVLMLLNYRLEIIQYNRRCNKVEHARIHNGVWDVKDHVQSLIPPC